MSSSSSSSSVVCVQCRCLTGGAGGEAADEGEAAFDLAAAPATNISHIYAAIKDTFPHLPPPFITDAAGEACAGFRLSYTDEDGDEVELETTDDLQDALHQATNKSPHILNIFIKSPTHVAGKSSLLGEWETVTGKSPALAARPTPAAEVAPLPDAKHEPTQAKHEPAKAAPADIPEKMNEPDAKSGAAPAASAGVLGWLWRSKPAASSSAAASATTTTPISPSTSAPSSAPENVSDAVASDATPASAKEEAKEASEPALSDSLPPSASVISCASSAATSEKAGQEFWEMGASQELGQADAASQTNSFVEAMDELTKQQQMANSGYLTQCTLSMAMSRMLAMAEESAGVNFGAGAAPSSHDWCAKPSPALLDALAGIRADAFEPVIQQFAQVCRAHVQAREERARAEEAAAVAKLVVEMEERARQEAERAAAEEREREEALRRAEEEARRREEELRAAEKARMVEERLRAEEERQAKIRAEEEEAAALIRREERRLQEEFDKLRLRQEELARQLAARASQPQDPRPAGDNRGRVPMLPAEPCLAPEQLQQSPQVHAPSPVLVPAVPVPVASPISEPASNAAARFNVLLQELRDMGFTDDALNTRLLQLNHLDVGAVLDWHSSNALLGGELKAALDRENA